MKPSSLGFQNYGLPWRIQVKDFKTTDFHGEDIEALNHSKKGLDAQLITSSRT